MSIAITGASGFIGGNLRKRLERENVPTIAIPHTMPLQDITKLLKDQNVQTVVHLASIFIGEHKPEDIDLLIQSNIGFGTYVLEACRQAGIKRVIITGSSWQHSENSSVNLYGALKSGLESVARYYADAHGISIAFLKLYDSFGEGDQRAKLIPLLLKAFRAPESATQLLLSEGKQIVDFTHVDNSVEAILRANEWTRSHAGTFRDFRVSGREPMPLRDFVLLIEETIDHRFDIQWGARPYRDREVMTPWSDAPEVPGYEPKVTLREGFRRVFTKS